MGKEMSQRQAHYVRESIIIDAARSNMFRSSLRQRNSSGLSEVEENIGFANNLSDTLSKEIGRNNGKTPSRARQVSDRFLEFVWMNTPFERKAEITYEDFMHDKVQLAEKMSASRNSPGAVRVVRLAFEDGVRTIDDLVQTTGLSREIVRSSSRSLIELGHCIEMDFVGKYLETFKQIESEKNDDTIRELIESLPGYIAVQYCYSPYEGLGKEEPSLTTLKGAVKGLYTYKADRVTEILEVVDELKIPYAEAHKILKNKPPLIYYVFARKHTDRIRKAFEDPRIQKIVFAH